LMTAQLSFDSAQPRPMRPIATTVRRSAPDG
jgi:hypothetical protein